MLIFISAVLALKKSLQLKDIKELSSIDRNCSAKQSFVDSFAELVGLVAIFRHGDRAPLAVESDIWRRKSCIKCSETCRSLPCTDGMLTKKGYIQAKKLGKYIRKHYRTKFHALDSLTGYHSNYERSVSTLHGVLAGLNEWHYEIFKEDSIVSTSNVKILKNIILNTKLNEIKKRSAQEYKIYDEIIADYCSETPFNCSKFSCDPKAILSFVADQQKDFLEYVNLIKSNIIAMGITLGDFGKFLRREMLKRQSITLVSGHDSLITKVLSSLNINITKLPSYTSTIFLEIWRDKNREEFVRVIYDGSIKKFGLYNEDRVSFDNFIKYIDMFNKANKRAGPIINGDMKKPLTGSELRKATAVVYNAYASLLHTIQRNGVDVKPSKRFATSNLPKAEESNEDLYDPMRQLLSASTTTTGKSDTKTTDCGNKKLCDGKIDRCAICTKKCESETRSPCEKACQKSPCESSCKSAFNSLPGTCAMFDSTSCEEYKKLVQPCSDDTCSSCKCGKSKPCKTANPSCAAGLPCASQTNPSCVDNKAEDSPDCDDRKLPKSYVLNN